MELPTPPCVVWFSGLSGAGKTTLATMLEAELIDRGVRVQLLDGDKIRAQQNNTNFTREGRLAHLKAVALQAKELEAKGTLVIGAFITPYEEARAYLRDQCDLFIDVWVDTSLAECERRDTKGLYQKARKNEVQHFTGISDPFETPVNANIKLHTDGKSVEQTFSELCARLSELRIL